MIALDLKIILTIILAVCAILALWIFRLERRLAKLLHGKDAKTLEDTIGNIMTDLKSIKQSIIMIAKELETMDNRIRHSISRVNTVRFNPFRTEGGNQSFATAFLNEDGDGVVLSSIYSRDKTAVYAKPVTNLASEHELTKEERDAINKK